MSAPERSRTQQAAEDIAAGLDNIIYSSAPSCPLIERRSMQDEGRSKLARGIAAALHLLREGRQ